MSPAIQGLTEDTVVRLCLTVLPIVFLASGALAQEASAPAPAGVYKTDPSHSSLSWSFRHSGLSNYTARFVGVDARVDWKPDAPETSTLSVSIDPLSARTDYPWPEKVDFDAEIGAGPPFLAGQPITFKSKSIEITGDNTGKIMGTLTFREQAHPAVLDVTFNGSTANDPNMSVPKLGFSATATILRSTWGLDFGIPGLGDEVHIVVETQLVPEDHQF